MGKRLKDNLGSSYLEAAQKLYSKKARRKIIAYVESYDDIAFWRSLLGEFENEERYFQIMLPSATSLAKGKKMVLMNTLDETELGKHMIACVDSDYDYLLQGVTHVSRKINKNPYIFQTYAYAIENYHCYAEGLHEVCVQSTLNDRHVVDFPEFMKQYSQIAYPLFLWSVYFYRMRELSVFPLMDFCSYVRIHNVNLNNIGHCLREMESRVNAKLSELRHKYPKAQPVIEGMKKELASLGLKPETTYLFIQGHHIMDNVVMKLLNPVCTILRREREQEIKYLAEHNIQFMNELTCYQNSQCSVELMLRKNTNYKDSFLYKRLEKDIEDFLDSL